MVIAVDDESHLYEPLSEVFYVSCKLLYSLKTWKETGMTPFNPPKEEGSKGQVDTNIFCRFASQPGRAGNRMISDISIVLCLGDKMGKACLEMQASHRTSGTGTSCVYSLSQVFKSLTQEKGV